MAFTDTTSLRSQLRTNVPDDIRIVGRVSSPAGTASVTGRGYTFLYSGVAGIYYVFFGAGVTATFDGAGAITTVTNSGTTVRITGWNLEPIVVSPETAANVRSYFAIPVSAPSGGQNIGLQIKSVVPGGALTNPANALDGFAFEIYTSTTEVRV